MIEDVAIPFQIRGNRRVLTDAQVAREPWLLEFIERFRGSFERDDVLSHWCFLERSMIEGT